MYQRHDFDRRANPRLKLFQPAEMVIDADTRRVHLLDLSCGGAQVHASTPPPVGARVGIAVRHSLGHGRVAWVRGNRFGVKLAASLSEGQVAEIIDARANVVAQAAERIGVLDR